MTTARRRKSIATPRVARRSDTHHPLRIPPHTSRKSAEVMAPRNPNSEHPLRSLL
jgi:hypothetical protein